MTDGQIALLMIGVAAAIWLFVFKRKKPTEVFFVDVIEVWERPRKRLAPALVNMAIVAGIVLFIWIMNR